MALVMNVAMASVSTRRELHPGRVAGYRRTHGFTLFEIAVVLFIITALMGAILVPLTTQVAQRKFSDTQKTLDDVKDALLGFAMSNTRLPCPASGTSNGTESFCTNAAGACGAEIVVPPAALPGHGRCFAQYNGFVPGIALGVSAVDAQGYGVDAWGTRLRYGVTAAQSNAFTASNGMRNATLGTLAPDLNVCASSTGVTATSCNTAPALTNSAPAVIYSLGPNANTGGGTSADEAANLNNTQVFISRVRTDRGAASGEFDDLVTWLSEMVLYNRMVAAGQLP